MLNNSFLEQFVLCSFILSHYFTTIISWSLDHSSLYWWCWSIRSNIRKTQLPSTFQFNTSRSGHQRCSVKKYGCWNVAKVEIFIMCFVFMLHELLFLLYISYLCYTFYHLIIKYLYKSFLNIVINFYFLFDFKCVITIFFSLYVQNCYNVKFLLQKNICILLIRIFLLSENFIITPFGW